MSDTYKIMRGWRDGEIMEPHSVCRISADATVKAVDFDSFDAARRYAEIHGGYVQRGSDSAIWVGEWINEETGYAVSGGTQTIETVTETITAAVTEILKTGNSAPKLYLRVRPNGTVDVSEETSWCCSPDEYYGRVPHTLSLEVLQSTRDYSHLSEGEIEEYADNAQEAAEQIVAGWQHDIGEWFATGNCNLR